jgi:hypothetical protein
MRRELVSLVFACVWLFSQMCEGQGSASVHGNVFREAAMGLTYEFPEKFSAKFGSEMPVPFRDATGRERFILTLWDPAQRGGALRMAFLYDTKQRTSDRTRDTIALAYIGEIRRAWLGVKGVEVTAPTKISEPSYDYWRLDISGPDQVPRYSSSIVITLADRRVLAIKAGAPSQSELDSEVASLAQMRFDKSQK